MVTSYWVMTNQTWSDPVSGSLWDTGERSRERKKRSGAWKNWECTESRSEEYPSRLWEHPSEEGWLRRASLTLPALFHVFLPCFWFSFFFFPMAMVEDGCSMVPEITCLQFKQLAEISVFKSQIHLLGRVKLIGVPGIMCLKLVYSAVAKETGLCV